MRFLARTASLLALAVVPFAAHALTPNDPYFANGYELPLLQIQAPAAWDITTGSSSVVVAVIDSGIDTNHVELSNNIWTNSDELPGNGVDDDKNGYIDDLHGWDFAYNTRELTPTGNHGSQVAGLIGAIGNNGTGIAGLNWSVKLMSLIVFPYTGGATTANISEAIHYATDNGAHIINVSIGGVGTNYDYTTAYDEAITYAFAHGVTVVAAAGNGQRVDGVGRNLNVNPGSPVCNDGKYNMVIGVAAVDDDDTKTSWSDYGSNCIDLSAPGREILSTARTTHGNYTNPDYSYGDGTSFAAPLVAGAAALIKAKYPAATNVQIADVLHRSADSINAVNPNYSGHLGAGRLNVYRALTTALDPALTLPDLIPPTNPTSANMYGATSNSSTVPQLGRVPRYEFLGAADNASGVKGYYVLWTTDTTADATTGTFITDPTYTVPLIPSAGTYYLQLKTVDGNDNVSTGIYWTYLAAPDLTVPTIAFTTSTKPRGSTYYTTKLVISFKTSDKKGLTTSYFRWDNDAYKSGSQTTALTGRHTLYFYVVDEYGNATAERAIVFKLVPQSYTTLLSRRGFPKPSFRGTVILYQVMNERELRSRKLRLSFTDNRARAKELGIPYIDLRHTAANKITLAYYNSANRTWIPVKTAVSKGLKFLEGRIDQPGLTAFGVFLR